MKILMGSGARNIAQTAQTHVRNLLLHVNPKPDQSLLMNVSHVTKGAEIKFSETTKQSAKVTSAADVKCSSAECRCHEHKAGNHDNQSAGVQGSAVFISDAVDPCERAGDHGNQEGNTRSAPGPPLARSGPSSLAPVYGRSTAVSRRPTPAVSLHTSSPFSHNLRRFLDVIGTDPKEARYWFRYFQKMTTAVPMFAVVQIDEDVVRESEALHRLDHDDDGQKYDLDRDSPLSELCGYLAFLHRHDMKCVIVHGRSPCNHGNDQNLHQEIAHDSQLITDLLEKHGAQVRQIGVPPIHVTLDRHCGGYQITSIDPYYLHWAQTSGRIPLLSNIAVTTDGRLAGVALFDAVTALSLALTPLKVLIVNMEGSIVDQHGKVIPNINLPHEESAACRSPWCTDPVRDKIHDISALLSRLQDVQQGRGKTLDTAVIITSCTTLLTELFTHHGSGTFFKITEKINAYKSLDKVDNGRLTNLVQMAFGRDLKTDFIEQIQDSIDTIFISEAYSAAAIVTKEPGISVPYLDKFVVRKDHQDNCVGRILWEQIHHVYPQLFWRSRNVNLINPWYFKRSEGSWSDGEWTVFWYGIQRHRLTSTLIDYALSKRNSFKAPDPLHVALTPREQSSSQWSALKYM